MALNLFFLLLPVVAGENGPSPWKSALCSTQKARPSCYPVRRPQIDRGVSTCVEKQVTVVAGIRPQQVVKRVYPSATTPQFPGIQAAATQVFFVNADFKQINLLLFN